MNNSFDQKVSDLLPNHFVFPKPNTQEAVDKFVSMSVPEPYQIREAREALIKAIKDFSALYEDEGVSFDEVKMEVAVMQMLTEHFNALAKEQNQVCGSLSLVCDSEEKFLSFFDEGNRWFAELLIGMRELEFNNILDIDIVLRGSQPASKIIHTSGGKINKTINDLHVTNSQLIKIVERFTGMASALAGCVGAAVESGAGFIFIDAKSDNAQMPKSMHVCYGNRSMFVGQKNGQQFIIEEQWNFPRTEKCTTVLTDMYADSKALFEKKKALKPYQAMNKNRRH